MATLYLDGGEFSMSHGGHQYIISYIHRPTITNNYLLYCVDDTHTTSRWCGLQGRRPPSAGHGETENVLLYIHIIYTRERGGFHCIVHKYNNKIFASPRFAARERGGGFKRTFRKVGSCSSVRLLPRYYTHYIIHTIPHSKSLYRYNIHWSRDDYR